MPTEHGSQPPGVRTRPTYLVTGGAGFIGSHLCERLLAAGARGALRRQLLHRPASDNIAPSAGRSPAFEFLRHDVTFPLYVEVDEIYNLACPASPRHYQRDPVQTTKTSVLGAINMLGLAKRHRAPDPAGLDQRGLRRPAGAPAARGLLGQRQPDRPARLLRRRQALRRDAVLRLSPPARLRDQGRAHLQHLRPAHAARRRPRGVQLHRAGAARRADHDLRRRQRRRARSATSTTWSRASSA